MWEVEVWITFRFHYLQIRTDGFRILWRTCGRISRLRLTQCIHETQMWEMFDIRSRNKEREGIKDMTQLEPCAFLIDSGSQMTRSVARAPVTTSGGLAAQHCSITSNIVAATNRTLNRIASYACFRLIAAKSSVGVNSHFVYILP